MYIYIYIERERERLNHPLLSTSGRRPRKPQLPPQHLRQRRAHPLGRARQLPHRRPLPQRNSHPTVAHAAAATARANFHSEQS